MKGKSLSSLKEKKELFFRCCNEAKPYIKYEEDFFEKVWDNLDNNYGDERMSDEDVLDYDRHFKVWMREWYRKEMI